MNETLTLKKEIVLELLQYMHVHNIFHLNKKDKNNRIIKSSHFGYEITIVSFSHLEKMKWLSCCSNVLKKTNIKVSHLKQ